MRDSLEHLWDRICEGDHDAWREVVVTFTPLVLAVARRSGLSQADAEDCAQYAWYSLYKSRRSLKDPLSLPAWLIRVTSRRSQRIIRKDIGDHRRRQHADQPVAPELPDDELLKFERAAMVHLALGQIGPLCRALLEALFLAEVQLTYEEIAGELGIPVNSMGPTRARCLAKVRRALEEMNYWPCT